MALQLYRRHRKGCKTGRPEDFKSGKLEEGRRGWKRCNCLIHASGTLGGKFNRQSTGEWEWGKAEGLVAVWQTAGAWPSEIMQPKPEPPPVLVPPPPPRTTVTEVIGAYLAKCWSREIQTSTLAKYKTLTNQLTAYCTEKGYVYIDQLGVVDMDRFYGSWKDGKKGKAKKLERLKGFVKFCVKRKWLVENIAEDLEPPPQASDNNPKTPFDDEELGRIYEACDKIGPPTKPGAGYRNWGGDDVRDFIDLSLYTGLRISDVATFNISRRLNGNDVYLRMHKTGQPLCTWIPDWLVARLRAREKIHCALIFNCGKTGNAKQLCDIWRNKRLKLAFKLAGPFSEKATPHRFRHTFARILLEKGVEEADVAELIGDTVEMVRKYYSKWVKTRQLRLSRILQDAFEDKPQPRVVAIR
jgi:site-specific recombinase XerD